MHKVTAVIGGDRWNGPGSALSVRQVEQQLLEHSPRTGTAHHARLGKKAHDLTPFRPTMRSTAEFDCRSEFRLELLPPRIEGMLEESPVPDSIDEV